MTQALLVGSRPAWLSKLRPHLAKVGIEVLWHWEFPTDARKGIPSACKLMLLSTDCNAHALSASALSLARSSNLPFVHISHRWAQAQPVLERAGFRVLEPIAPPPPPESTMPESFDHSPQRQNLSGAPDALYPSVLRELAADPWLNATALSAIFDASRSVLQRAAFVARDTLGIRAASGSGAAEIIDRSRYEAWCMKLGVTPVKEDMGPVRVMSFAPVESAQPKPVEAPVPAPEPPPASTQTLPEVRAAVALLCEAMVREGVVSILIEGKQVTLTRRVTLTDSFSI